MCLNMRTIEIQSRQNNTTINQLNHHTTTNVSNNEEYNNDFFYCIATIFVTAMHQWQITQSIMTKQSNKNKMFIVLIVLPCSFHLVRPRLNALLLFCIKSIVTRDLLFLYCAMGRLFVLDLKFEPSHLPRNTCPSPHPPEFIVLLFACGIRTVTCDGRLYGRYLIYTYLENSSKKFSHFLTFL